jgi:tetratricopeptide (TPR) repeat protein
LKSYLLDDRSVRPDKVSHHYELGRTLEVLKRPEEAIAEYEKALSLPKTASDDDKNKKHAKKRLDILRR